MNKKMYGERNLGSKETGHGSRSPKDLGPAGSQQVVPGRHEVSLVPGDASNDAEANTPAGGGE